MSKLFMRRTVTGLAPASDDAAEALRRLAINDHCFAVVTKPRHLPFHRYYFAMLNVVADATGMSVEDLLRDVKFRIGHYDKHPITDRETGEVIAEHTILRSISFQNMDEVEFRGFVDRSLAAISEHIVPGIDEDEIRLEVERNLR
jgi:hypothetical protein